MSQVTSVNVWCESDDLWYFAAWCGDEYDSNGRVGLPDDSTAEDAIAWAQLQFPTASVRVVEAG